MIRLRRFFSWLFSFFGSSRTTQVIRSRGTHDYRPKPGKVWNPIAKYPRNEPCFCGSGIKFKKCCLDLAMKAVDQEIAEKTAPLVKRVRRGNA